MAAITVAVAYGVALSLSRSLQALTLAALALFIGVFVGVVVMPIFVTNPVGVGGERGWAHFNRLFNAAYAYQINELRASQCQ